MTDAELRDAAVAELKLTTQGYLKSNGQPRSLVGAHWKKGLDLLAQIGQVSPPPPPPAGVLPAVITAGGTYSGTRAGTLQIRTSQPVVIEDSVITNTGTGYLIDANFPGVQLTLRRTTLNGGTGQAIYANQYMAIHVENCTVNKTWGIRLDNCQQGATVRITKNRINNVVFDPTTNGNGMWLAHSLQMWSSGARHASIEIDWNEFVNDPGQSSCEDVISIGGGTSGAWIHDNGIHGAYPLIPSGSYSGGGIMVGDSGGSNSIVERNIAVGTLNYIYSILGGANNIVRNNRGVSDSRNDAGVLYTAQSSGGLGLQLWNINNQAGFANNVMDSNAIGVLKANGQDGDTWLGTSGNGNVITNSMHIVPNQANKTAEWNGWLAKLQAAGVVVGA